MPTTKNTHNAQKHSKGTAQSPARKEDKVNFACFPANNKWFDNAIKELRQLYDEKIQSGCVDKGFAWAYMYLETFIEGVFSANSVPRQIEVEVPKGSFRLTTIWKDGKTLWLIRNDSFGCVAIVNPSEMGQ